VTTVHATHTTFVRALAAVALAALGASGCSQFLRDQGRSPSQLAILTLEAASGAQPTAFGGTLDSDVITNVKRTVGGAEVRIPTVFSDAARVTMRLFLKDQGVPGVGATPTPVNQVTITRYRVVYRRSDGRNTPGVDVPYPFDSATTFTIPTDASVTQSFELVRHTSKQEAPLAELRSSSVIISTVADITFYGRDMAGNEIAATGSIGILFGNFGDPE